MRAFNADASRVFADETKRAASDANMANAVANRAEQQAAVQQRANESHKLELAALRREHAELKRVANGIQLASKENDAAVKRELIVDDVRAKAAAKAAATSAKVANAAARYASETQRKQTALDAKLAKAEERHAEHLAARVSTAVRSYTPKKDIDGRRASMDVDTDGSASEDAGAPMMGGASLMVAAAVAAFGMLAVGVWQIV